MSIRGIWILNIPKTNSTGKIIFSRLFPTVERRAKVYEGDKYIAIPDNIDFADHIYNDLGFRFKTEKFLESRDTCKKLEQKPVFEVITHSGKLWPLLVIEQRGYLYCCLPLVEDGAFNRPPLIHIPGISSGFSLILNMSDYLGPLAANIDETNQKFADLHMYLNVASPFGTPVDVAPATVRMSIQGKIPPTIPKTKQPAWKPAPHKGKNVIQCTIVENVRAVQYDSSSIPDVWDVYGTVTCKAELDGQSPDVTLTIGQLPGVVSYIPLENTVFNPCVHNIDLQQSSKGPRTRAPSLYKVRFTPPLESFALCHYSTASHPDLPIKGYYQMKGEATVELLVQLQLNEKVKNNFEYCELQIPFHHRGPIINHDSNCNHGQILVAPNKKILVWNIGQKFPAKHPDITLKSTVYFGDYKPDQPSIVYDDPFCVGQNSYVQLYFKINDYTYSSNTIDPKLIHVVPNMKYKFSLVRELMSSDYKIWNSHGDAQISFPPPKYLRASITS